MPDKEQVQSISYDITPVSEATFKTHTANDDQRFDTLETKLNRQDMKLDEQTLILKQINSKVVPLDEDRAFKERLGRLAWKTGAVIVAVSTVFEIIWHFFVPPKI